MEDLVLDEPPYKMHDDLLEKIKNEAELRNIKFAHERELYAPPNRIAFAVYQGLDLQLQHVKAASIGYLIQAKKERNYEDRAWNRFEIQDREWFLKYFKKKGFKCFVIQVWQNLDEFLVIPFDLLLKVPKFLETGNFTMMKEGASFRLRGLDEYLSFECRGTLSLLFSHFRETNKGLMHQ